MSMPFYRAFEDRYRGSRDVIKQRLRAYAPFFTPLAEAGPDGAPAPALDLGCGRGEWLELLGEAGYAARGIDLDDAMLAACRERGLNVQTADALEALRAQPDASLALVSAFHLVEHIPFDQVRELIAEALRALRPGGLLIMETPNPENLVVGSSSFYMDPSHLHPLPPPLLAFAAEHAGYARLKVVRLQEEARLHTSAAIGLINVLEGASPDYSVVAQKAAAPDRMSALDAAFATEYGIALAPLAVRYDEQLEQERGALHRALGQQAQRMDAEHQRIAQLAQQASQLAQQAGLLEQRLQQAEVRADAMGQRVVDLLSSSSWRVTAPLRAASLLLQRVAGRLRRLPGGARRRARAAVLAAGQAVLRRPHLMRLLRALLRHAPGLQARLFRVVLNAQAGAPGAGYDSEMPDQLSPRAARIYHALKNHPLHHHRAAPPAADKESR